MKKAKHPRDISQLAKSIVDLTTGEKEQDESPKKTPAAVELGLLGGQKGGKARADGLTPEQRSEIAKRTAKARWEDKNS